MKRLRNVMSAGLQAFDNADREDRYFKKSYNRTLEIMKKLNNNDIATSAVEVDEHLSNKKLMRNRHRVSQPPSREKYKYTARHYNPAHLTYR